MLSRTILASSVTALLLIGGGCATTPTSETKQAAPRMVQPIEGYTAYDKSADLKFKFQVPKDWEKDETVEDGDVVTAFYSPFESESDLYRENIVVTALKIPDDVEATVEDFVEQSHEGLKKSVEGLKSVEAGKTDVGGYPAKKYTFTGQLNYNGTKLNVKGEEYFVIHNGVAYQFTYGAAASKFDTFKPTADKIIGSIELK